MSLIHYDTDFADSCAPQHYTPERGLTRVERFVRAASCLALFAAMGVVFAVGLSGCGGGDTQDDRFTLPRVNCAANPEKCT